MKITVWEAASPCSVLRTRDRYPAGRHVEAERAISSVRPELLDPNARRSFIALASTRSRNAALDVGIDGHVLSW